MKEIMIPDKKQEKKYYKIIKKKFEDLFKEKFEDIYFEITASGNFSPKLKSKIPQNRDIIFSFLKGKGKSSPDITGYVQKQYSSDFVIIEIKKEEIKLDDIYQTKKYKDLFDSRFTFLVSLKPIPEEIKRLCKIACNILHTLSIYQSFVLIQFDEKSNKFVEWFEENIFEKDYIWK